MNTERHILSAFDRDLETVQALVVKMGGLVESAISEAAAALEAIAHPALRVSCANFLSVAPEPIYDAVVMNPPFEGTHCLDHVRHAYDFLSDVDSSDICPFESIFVLWGREADFPYAA